MRSRPQFTLRTLFVVVTIFALLLGAVGWWYRMQVAEHRRQLTIAERIQNTGRGIGWETQIPSILKWSENMPWSDAFLRINSLTIGLGPSDIGPDGLRDDVVSQLRSLASLTRLLLIIDTGDWNLRGENASLIKSYIEQTKLKLPYLEIEHMEHQG
jgi:hypothetical protein